MIEKAIQEYYPESTAHCYGCGRLNEDGLQIKSYWNGEQAECEYTPRPYHTAIPGYVYGGLIASLIDCHATGTAAAAAYQAAGRSPDSDPPLRFVTAALQVNYLQPTPLGPALKLRAWPTEIKGRKVVVSVELSALDQVCARGEVVCVQMPENMRG